jgi:plastocyanin
MVSWKNIFMLHSGETCHDHVKPFAKPASTVFDCLLTTCRSQRSYPAIAGCWCSNPIELLAALKREVDMKKLFQRMAQLLLFVVATVLFGAAPGFSQGDKTDNNTVVVHMTDQPPMKFVPDHVSIKVGQSVEWINDTDDQGPAHNVTTDPSRVQDPSHVSSPNGAESFDSGVIKPGRSFVHKFTVPGTYHYTCSPHEGTMRGQIDVQP